METFDPKRVKAFNREALEEATRAQVAWADRVFGPHLVVSTSFGIQSAVILHLVSRMLPRVPVVLVGDFNLTTTEIKSVLPRYTDLTNGNGSTLKDQQYERIEYATTRPHALIPPITEEVRSRIQSLEEQAA